MKHVVKSYSGHDGKCLLITDDWLASHFGCLLFPRQEAQVEWTQSHSEQGDEDKNSQYLARNWPLAFQSL
jgi:hypothetical protein